MNKKLLNLVATSAVTISLAACMDMQNAFDMPTGKSEQTNSSTDSSGTKTTRTSATEVERDGTGHNKTVVKTKTTRDPEGLMNKTTTSQTRDSAEEDKK
jgi:hypothetical protein